MRTNNHVSPRVSSDERAHWDVLEQEELRLGPAIRRGRLIALSW